MSKANPLNVRQVRICGPGLPHPDYATIHDAEVQCPACRDESLFDDLYVAVAQALRSLALADKPEFDTVIEAYNRAVEEYNPAKGRYDYELAREAGDNAEEVSDEDAD